LDATVVLSKILQELSECFKTGEDDVTVVQVIHPFLGTRYLRTICVNDCLIFGALARFNGLDKFRGDRNLVKRRHSAIHNYSRHDLAGERVCTEMFHALYIIVMEGTNGTRNKSGLWIEPARVPVHFEDQSDVKS
jgi:hypothetical protein